MASSPSVQERVFEAPAEAVGGVEVSVQGGLLAHHVDGLEHHPSLDQTGPGTRRCLQLYICYSSTSDIHCTGIKIRTNQFEFDQI